MEEGEGVEEDVLKSAEDDRRDHQKVGEVQEDSQKASCEKAQEAEESIPSVLSEGLQSSEKVAAPKHKKEGKIFSNDEENNVVRQSGLGEEIGKHEKIWRIEIRIFWRIRCREQATYMTFKCDLRKILAPI